MVVAGVPHFLPDYLELEQIDSIKEFWEKLPRPVFQG
jgi:hypothetical protein